MGIGFRESGIVSYLLVNRGTDFNRCLFVVKHQPNGHSEYHVPIGIGQLDGVGMSVAQCTEQFFYRLRFGCVCLLEKQAFVKNAAESGEQTN